MNQRTLITSALPYINGVKHLGNLAGSLLPADVYARFLRASGEEVLFICATDEHGTPAELAADAAGVDVATYCQVQHELQAEACKAFNLSFDHFGRTSSARNRELTQQFGRRLSENGFLEERSIKQVYSPTDRRYLPDRYVIGTCPHCGYDQARGDQCENCTRLLDPLDLLSPRSAISGATDLEVRDTKHLFLLQSQLEPTLRNWIEGHKDDWPVLATSIALKWLDEGLNDRSITRDLQWGVPVDRPGFEDKVYYVWFDAPIEYIAATQEWADLDSTRDWERWWRRPAETRYIQFLAKDNVPFHTVGFPATILASRDDWQLVDYIKAFNWLTYYGGKFSTSRHVGIFMDDALELLPADYWRYYLIANAPESNDSSFTWESFAAAVNKDLVGVLGNYVNRILHFCVSKFGNELPLSEPGEAESLLASDLDNLIERYTCELRVPNFRKAAQTLREIWSKGNVYFDGEAPWKTLATDRTRSATVVVTSINLLRLIATLTAPLLPSTADHIFDALNVGETERYTWPTRAEEELLLLKVGHPIQVPQLLFRRVEDSDVAAWRERFGSE